MRAAKSRSTRRVIASGRCNVILRRGSRITLPVSAGQSYCLFLDELNACSHEVQKAFYSLIQERRIGEYCPPEGSVVIGAGNRAQDSAIVKPMSSALIHRMIHVRLKVSHRDWLDWASANNIHPLVMQWIQNRPDHLWVQPPKHEETSPEERRDVAEERRDVSRHMLSGALHEYGDALNHQTLQVLAFGCVSAEPAGQFKAFPKQIRSRYKLRAILAGDAAWPAEPHNRDILLPAGTGVGLQESPRRHDEARHTEGALESLFVDDALPGFPASSGKAVEISQNR